MQYLPSVSKPAKRWSSLAGVEYATYLSMDGLPTLGGEPAALFPQWGAGAGKWRPPAPLIQILGRGTREKRLRSIKCRQTEGTGRDVTEGVPDRPRLSHAFWCRTVPFLASTPKVLAVTHAVDLE